MREWVILALFLCVGCVNMDRSVVVRMEGKGIRCPYGILKDGKMTFIKTTKTRK